MKLLTSCIRFQHRASTDLSNLWLHGTDLPEPDKAASPTSSFTSSLRRARSSHARCPDTTKRPKHPIVRKIIQVFHRPPACVWIRNESDEDVVVVVSRLGPMRMLGGAEIGGSPAGGTLRLDLDTFSVGATRKTLQPQEVAQFPLWSHSAKSGVVSIYKASDRTTLIGNDMVEAGNLAIYQGGPNMAIHNYWGECVSLKPPTITQERVTKNKASTTSRHHNKISDASTEAGMEKEIRTIMAPAPAKQEVKNRHLVRQEEAEPAVLEVVPVGSSEHLEGD